jgi:hypothetical protein
MQLRADYVQQRLYLMRKYGIDFRVEVSKITRRVTVHERKPGWQRWAERHLYLE